MRGLDVSFCVFLCFFLCLFFKVVLGWLIWMCLFCVFFVSFSRKSGFVVSIVMQFVVTLYKFTPQAGQRVVPHQKAREAGNGKSLASLTTVLYSTDTVQYCLTV